MTDIRFGAAANNLYIHTLEQVSGDPGKQVLYLDGTR